MQIQFATKKVDGAYEAALIVDTKFKRSGSSKNITDLFVKLCGPILANHQEDGAEIAVSVVVFTAAEATRADAREARQRQTQEAEAEAAEIERLTKAVEREKNARAKAETTVAE